MSLQCQTCGKLFNTFKKYIIHTQYVHPNIFKNFICPKKKCKRVFNRRHTLKVHLQKIHNFYDAKGINEFGNNIDNTETSNISLNNAEISKDNLNDGDVDKANEFSKDENINYLECFKNIHKANVVKIISELYNLDIARIRVQEILDCFSNFQSTLIESIIRMLSSSEAFEKSEIFKVISEMLLILKNPFSELNTEFKRFQYFEESGKLLMPQKVLIGIGKERFQRYSEAQMNLKERYAYFIPLRNLLKTFLEIPNVLKTIKDYQYNLNIENKKSGNMRNIIHGSLWKNNVPNNDELVLPLLLYYDDFETGNPLGSHAGIYKMGAVYCTIATIPPSYASRLENVFLTLLFHTADRSEFGNKNVFQCLISEITFLENEGINLVINGKEINCKFVLILIIGDNLGLHSLFGLNETFSSTYFCRMCVASKDETYTQTFEIEAQLRNTNDYDLHVENNVGIKEKCLWNDLKNFHVYNNLVVDVMHDLFEGIHRYSMALIIQNFIENNFFNLEMLNNRIQYFSYEPQEKKKSHLLYLKKTYKMDVL